MLERHSLTFVIRASPVSHLSPARTDSEIYSNLRSSRNLCELFETGGLKGRIQSTLLTQVLIETGEHLDDYERVSSE